MKQTQFLVIGAGPFAIATAAYAKHLGLDVSVVGRTLEFWKSNMPAGMFLRSNYDWHLDARDVHTFERYLEEQNLKRLNPIPLRLFCDYVLWFMKQNNVSVTEQHVKKLVRDNGAYIATLSDGSKIQASKVLLGLGFAFFRNLPSDLIMNLPEGSYSHTCDTVEFTRFRGKRILIVGGRQSAFEWAALLAEAGAEHVDLSFRHPKPQFTEADWSWVLPMAQRTLEDHTWWRKLQATEQEQIRHKFWATGRLVLEPWLDSRVHRQNIRIYARTNVKEVQPKNGNYAVTLDNGVELSAHHILFATGYRPNMQNVDFLDHETIRSRMILNAGSPQLDAEFQTNLPGLYITGLAATNDFGPFFGFTVACPVAAKILGDTALDH